MQIRSSGLSIVLVILLEAYALPSTYIDFTHSAEVAINILLGSSNGYHGDAEDSFHHLEDRIMIILDVLGRHASSLADNLNTTDNFSGILQQIQSTVECLKTKDMTSTLKSATEFTTDAPLSILTGIKEIYLNKTNSMVRIKHPEEGGYQDNEHFQWLIETEDPEAVGFRIDVLSIALEECCDRIRIRRPDCHFDSQITSFDDTPLFVPGSQLNIIFTSDIDTNDLGFVIAVSTVYEMQTVKCPGTSKVLTLQQDTRLTIRHPENGDEYENDEQFYWIINNEDPRGVGFQVTFENINTGQCCDKLRIDGEYCSYGTYTTRTKSSVDIKGNTLNVTWASDYLGVDSGFILGITSLHQINKTGCYDYTCNKVGRCVRAHFDNWITWYDSVTACEAEGATLVVIIDEDMNNLVRSLLDDFQQSPWIGLSGDSSDNITWINGMSPDDYSYQRLYDEDYPAPDTFGCGVQKGTWWNFASCNEKRPYICEKKQQQNATVATY